VGGYWLCCYGPFGQNFGHIASSHCWTFLSNCSQTLWTNVALGISLSGEQRAEPHSYKLWVETQLLHTGGLGIYLRCLSGRVFQTCPNRMSLLGRPGSCRRDYISWLAWEHLSVPCRRAGESGFGESKVFDYLHRP